MGHLAFSTPPTPFHGFCSYVIFADRKPTAKTEKIRWPWKKNGYTVFIARSIYFESFIILLDVFFCLLSNIYILSFSLLQSHTEQGKTLYLTVSNLIERKS